MNFSNTSPLTGQLDSELLRTFLAVADAGSFTRGAERVSRTQSAVSLQIKRLEEQLGQPVFDRHPRGVALTPIGERLKDTATRVVALLDAALRELTAKRLAGLVRIGVPDEYGMTILPGTIARFAETHSDVEISVRCGFSANFPQAIDRGELDLAVHATETPRRDTQILAHERTFWMCSRQHAPYKRDPVPVALFDRTCWWRDRAIEALEAAGRRYHVAYTSESVAGVKAAIRSGAAIGVLAERSLDDGLRRLPDKEGFPSLPNSVLELCKTTHKVNAAVDAMQAAIIHAFKTSGGL